MNLIHFGKGTTYELGAVLGKDALGGKGAGLVEMSQMGIPVPPGFIVPTSASRDYAKLTTPEERSQFVDALMVKVMGGYATLSHTMGYEPLVSVRSGAPVSMPGMMDTILNVGVTSKNVEFWNYKLGVRARLDSQRRLIQMLASTAYGIDPARFAKDLQDSKTSSNVKDDKDLTAETLAKLVHDWLAVFSEAKGFAFPDTVAAQLRAAVVAVLESWGNERAKTYRKLNNIPEDMGTAVVIQAMVFGNANDDSGSGVLFSRDSSTGENAITGEFLPNAQGEDVVAGIRTPLPLLKMKEMWPEVLDELNETTCRLEQHYKDMVDIEFTVQDKKLYILQCRVGKRTAIAAFQIAYDMANEGLISREKAVGRVTREQYKITKRPVVAPSFKVEPNAKGLFGSAGIAVGKPVFSAKDAVDCSEPCILVTEETDPDDIAGMAKAAGILTATGGQTSHAAVVARSMNRPCVVGVSGIVDMVKSSGCKKITIDGNTGHVWFDVEVPVIQNGLSVAVSALVEWARTIYNAPVYITDMLELKGWAASQRKVTILINSPSLKNGIAAYNSIYEFPKKGNLTIDFRPVQTEVASPDDGPLASLYVAEPDNSAKTDTAKLAKSVSSNLLFKATQGATNLSGLTLVGVPASVLKQVGWNGHGGIKVASVVADTVADLLGGGSVSLGPSLVNNISQEDVAKAKELLEKCGGSLELVDAFTAPEPSEYQFYKALGP